MPKGLRQGQERGKRELGGTQEWRQGLDTQDLVGLTGKAGL